jgi:hypothetical protein
VEHDSEMKALTWKAMFASLNPSPALEVVAILAERLAMNGDEARSRDTEGADDSSAALES